jgi:hypothetical protein
VNTWRFWERLFSVLQTLAIVAGVVLIFFTRQTMVHQEAKDSADIVIKFNDYFDQKKYEGLINELDTDNPHTRIIIGIGQGPARFSEALVENYMSLFELLDDIYRQHLVSKEMIYQNFSDYIESAYKNDDIQFLIKRDRKNDPTYWVGFQRLAEEFKKR